MKTCLKLFALCATLGLFWSTACLAVTPTILASGLTSPGNMLVDGSSVYWIDDSTAEISSVSKTPGGTVFNKGTAASGINDFVQDTASLYFRVNSQGFAISKVSKAGVTTTSFGVDNYPLNAGSSLAIRPAGGVLYYDSYRDIPNDGVDAFLGIASISTLGGADQVLIYQDPGYDGLLNGGNSSGRAALQLDNLSYATFGGSPGASSTDSTYLYWADASFQNNIWQMPLIGGAPSAIVSGRTGIRFIATPTTGAAAGSIFWTEGSGGSYRLMRREVGGQIITVLTNLLSYDRCFAVDDSTVFCEQGGGVVQVSINGGAVTIVSSIAEVFGPVGLTLDANYIYCGNLLGEILRIPRPGGGGTTYTITVSASPSNGGTVGGGGTFASGSSKTVTATANGGFAFTNWTESGSVVSSSASYNFTLNGNRTLVANFRSNVISATYTVTPSAGANGSISPNTAQIVNSGSNVVFTATPAGGYVVNQWLVNSSVAQTGGNTFTLTNVTAGKTVQVTFMIPATAPANDNFTNAIVLSGTTIATTGSNLNATKESGEPNHANNAGGRSVWWTWTPAADSVTTVDTVGSSFDTLLAVYTGGAVNGLSLVAQNDDSGGYLTSRTSFVALAGTAYQIAVDGYLGASGNIVLNLTAVAPTRVISLSGNLAFGSVGTNYFSQRALTIFNTGNSPLSVSSITYPGGFSGDWSGAIPAGGSTNVTVTFSPTTLASYGGTISVNSDAISGNSSIATSGTGIDLFIPVSASYSGLFYNAAGASHQSSGFFAATTTTKGTFTAKILSAGKSYSLSGMMALDGSFSGSIARTGLSALSVQLGFSGDAVTGQISDGVWTAGLLAHRATFNSINNPAPKAGKYTLLIPGSTDPSIPPGGYSYGTVTVDGSGNVSFQGMLSDGTKVSQKTFLSQSNQWPFYASLPSGGGSIFGWLTFTNGPLDDINGLVNWFKLPLPTAKLYPAGFAIQAYATGSTYLFTPGLPVLNFEAGQVGLEYGTSQSFTNQIDIDPYSKVINLSINKLSLKITTTSGLFKGSVVNPLTGQSVPISGVVHQKQNVGYGYFPDLNESGTVYFGP